MLIDPAHVSKTDNPSKPSATTRSPNQTLHAPPDRLILGGSQRTQVHLMTDGDCFERETNNDISSQRYRSGKRTHQLDYKSAQNCQNTELQDCQAYFHMHRVNS